MSIAVGQAIRTPQGSQKPATPLKPQPSGQPAARPGAAGIPRKPGNHDLVADPHQRAIGTKFTISVKSGYAYGTDKDGRVVRSGASAKHTGDIGSLACAIKDPKKSQLACGLLVMLTRQTQDPAVANAASYILKLVWDDAKQHKNTQVLSHLESATSLIPSPATSQPNTPNHATTAGASLAATPPAKPAKTHAPSGKPATNGSSVQKDRRDIRYTINIPFSYNYGCNDFGGPRYMPSGKQNKTLRELAEMAREPTTSQRACHLLHCLADDNDQMLAKDAAQTLEYIKTEAVKNGDSQILFNWRATRQTPADAIKVSRAPPALQAEPSHIPKSVRAQQPDTSSRLKKLEDRRAELQGKLNAIRSTEKTAKKVLLGSGLALLGSIMVAGVPVVGPLITAVALGTMGTTLVSSAAAAYKAFVDHKDEKIRLKAELQIIAQLQPDARDSLIPA